MGRVDKVVFEARGAGGCSDSDYELYQTSCSGAWCVEDCEQSDLYLDGANLAAVVSLLRMPSEDPIACPFCGAFMWQLRSVGDEAAPDAWQWVVPRA